MIQRLIAVLLALLLLAAGAAWWRTTPPSPKTALRRTAAVTSAALVDEGTYAAARRLARLAATPEEQTLAQTALRVADHELALAFAAALRDVQAHPPALSPAALKIQDRLRQSQQMLNADQQRVDRLTADAARAKPSQKDELQDELELAKAQLDLDRDELEEADQDLLAAGGNPQQRIEAMVQEHDAQVKAGAGAPTLGALSVTGSRGSLAHFRDWLRLRQKLQSLSSAQAAAGGQADALAAQRTALANSLENVKGGIAELAHHTKSARAAAAPVAATETGTATARSSATASPAATGRPAAAPLTVAAPLTAAAHSSAAPRPASRSEDVAALLGQTKRIASDQNVLTLLERQAIDLRQLEGVYGQWVGVVESQSTAVLHGLLLDAAIVIAILLGLLFLDEWVQRLLNNPKLDRRQVETLRNIARVGLRVVAVLIILLILIGAPSQFGTMVGIVGAGLTVALKDFIVAFFGWLVLMGRNGIRLGDWVEINGVSGEVTELGMFHTVLLETGNWSDAGHPTGRRVTFTNSFAIEGHYFNFSTTGQWLWDELQVVVPAGSDPYPFVDAITKQVHAATAENARQAEQEWQRAVPSQRAKAFSGTPSVNIKPVVGGVEISVRYLTRAHERFALRAALYQAAVDLLGKKEPGADRSLSGVTGAQG